MLDSTETEASPDDRLFAPREGVKEAHALELRAESMRQYSERGAERTGELDRTEVGLSDDNRDVVAGRDQIEIDGMLEEHTGHGLVHVADEVEMNVEGPLRMHAHLEDNIIMGGVMTDEWSGGTFITAATTPTRSSPSSAPWRTRPTPPRSRTCSTPRAPPTTSTTWPGSTSRGRGTSRSPRSTSSRSRSHPTKQPPNRHPARARPPRGPGASSPRRSITPRPGPKGTTSGVPTARSTIGINSTGRN